MHRQSRSAWKAIDVPSGVPVCTKVTYSGLVTKLPNPQNRAPARCRCPQGSLPAIQVPMYHQISAAESVISSTALDI